MRSSISPTKRAQSALIFFTSVLAGCVGAPEPSTACISERCDPEVATTHEHTSSTGPTGTATVGEPTTEATGGDPTSTPTTGGLSAGDGDTTTADDTGELVGSSDGGGSSWTSTSTSTDDNDMDGDGFPTPEDCDDMDPEVHPGAVDDPLDPVDADCNVETDDVDGDGYSSAFGDCDDQDPSIHPDAVEVQNDVDDNCNASIDEEWGGGVAANLQTPLVAGLDFDYATAFNYPLGSGSAITHAMDYPVDKFYVCTEFREANWCAKSKTHLGEDFNDDFGTDQGLPVLSPAAGVVVDAGWGGAGWGNYVVTRHEAPPGGHFQLPSGETAQTVVVMAAHLQNLLVAIDQPVAAKQQIAEIGPKAKGSTAPHLHEEVIADLGQPVPGPGYSPSATGRVDPSEFFGLNVEVMGGDPILYQQSYEPFPFVEYLVGSQVGSDGASIVDPLNQTHVIAGTGYVQDGLTFYLSKPAGAHADVELLMPLSMPAPTVHVSMQVVNPSGVNQAKIRLVRDSGQPVDITIGPKLGWEQVEAQVSGSGAVHVQLGTISRPKGSYAFKIDEIVIEVP